DLIDGKRLQLALYALAAKQIPDTGTAVDGFYWPLFKAAPSKLRLQDFHYESAEGEAFDGARGAMDLAQAHVRRYLTAIAAGEFSPTAPRDGCPPYCPAKLWCWRYAPSRYA